MKIKTSSINEFQLIESLMQVLDQNPKPGMVGVGDDCAILSSESLFNLNNQSLVVTSDTLVEGKHFRLDLSSASDIGWKLAAVNVSDISAMGARPVAALISLGVPPETDFEFLKELYQGMGDILKSCDISLLGGDTVRTSEIVLTMTMLGIASASPIRRSGAKVGDDIWVSGEIGAAHLGLQLLSGKLPEDSYLRYNDLKRRHQRPEPRLALALRLSEMGFVSSMIDISDGLLADASHLSKHSNVTLEIDVNNVPLPVTSLPKEINLINLITGGDDYELLFTASVLHREQLLALSSREKEMKITRIGVVTKDNSNEVMILDQDKSMPLAKYLQGNSSGYIHFGT